MKKLFWFSVSLLIFSLSLLLLNTAVTKGGVTKTVEKPDPACGNDVFYGLTLDEFMQGVARYRQFHMQPLTASIRANTKVGALFEDARSCWYSLDTLKKFICLIEQYASQERVTSSALGIRFYYGMYKNPMIMDMSRRLSGITYPNYSAEHTLFMVPTCNIAGDDLDFDPRSIAFEMQRQGPGANRDSILFRTSFPYMLTFQSRVTQPLVLDMFSINAKAGFMGKNQGKLCPPTCPTSAISTMQVIDNIYPSISYK